MGKGVCKEGEVKGMHEERIMVSTMSNPVAKSYLVLLPLVSLIVSTCEARGDSK